MYLAKGISWTRFHKVLKISLCYEFAWFSVRQTHKVKNYIIYDIYNIFTSLNNIGINVTLEWIPSHVGILGNELADKEAKHSLSFKNIYVFSPLYKEDIKTLSRTFLKDMWQNKWDNNLKGRHLYDINKTVSFSITAPKLYRYNEILFFRLRTGYIKLNSYLNKIGFNPSNLCDTCQQEETVEHFLLKCKLYDTYRKTMFDQLLQLGVTNFNPIILLSGKNFQPVADYINHTNRF